MSSSNPLFNMARGTATMTAPPPFDFENVVLRVFPLRADIHALRLFCDRFLNIAPEFALFEPAAPYVFLEAINYGRMSAEASNFGWVSQNEVAFGVLLNWYEIVDGKRVFRDTASVCPFIFVDEETSVRGGREVFGWPKSLGWLTPGIDAWARDPRSPRTLFTLSAMVFPELFAGQRQETRVLFEIEQEPPLSLAEFPVDPFNQLSPLVNLPRAVMNSMKMAGDLVENLTRLPIRGFPLPGVPMPGGGPPPDPRHVAGPGFRTAPPWEMVRNTFGNLNPFAQLPAFNTINLKQFRDSERPGEVCYQALVNAKMTAKSIKRGGLLGQQAMALGDPSGGFSLKFHRYEAWPIIESLGLEVASESTEKGQQVATLKPVMPNWIETDFHYGTGEVLCWRSAYTDWARPPAEERPSKKPARKARTGRRAPEEPPARCREPHPFNTAQGGSLDQVRGPFHFNDVTMRVLPLVADEAKLQAFCDDYLNDRRDGFEEQKDGSLRVRKKKGSRPSDGLPNNLFRAWGNYVYLIVTNFERMTSELNVGWWARRQVAFAFPVKWYRARGDRWHLVSTALVSPFIYADSSVAATTGREMQGRPVVRADIEAASTAWLSENGPARSGDLLQLCTDVYPALNVGQKIERRKLLAITGRDALERGDEEGWRQVAVGWGETLFDELRSKQGPYDHSEPHLPGCLPSLNGLALELLSGRQPINHVSLKQFRDAEDPNRACYQAITLSPETLKRIYDLREIDDRLHVAIHRYPSQSIVESLGLEVKREESAGGSVVDYLQPVRPFWLRADVEAHLGRDIFWRAGSSTWNPASRAFEGPPRCMADPEWLGSMEMKDKPADLLFFERPEPAPFGRFEAKWVDVDPANKRRLQDIGSKLTSRRLRALKKEGGGEGTDHWAAAQGRVVPDDLPQEDLDRLAEAHAMASRIADLEVPLSSYYVGSRDDEPPCRRPVTPQMALETILSNEWLHFGRARWEQRKAAEVGDFDRRIRELAVAEGSELVDKLSAETITARELKEELARVERGAPPLKSPFVIRQDSIGHPEVRAWFEREYGLERLDDEYWYYVTPEIRSRRQTIRREIRAAVWSELGEAWSEELDALAPKMDKVLNFDKWPEHIDAIEIRELQEEIDDRFQRFDELRKSLPGLLKSAQSSREFERSYRDIQTRLQDIRAFLQEATFALAMISGETPLDSVEIKQLGAKRLETLRTAGITSVEALANQESGQLVRLLGVGEATAEGILEQARELASYFQIFWGAREPEEPGADRDDGEGEADAGANESDEAEG